MAKNILILGATSDIAAACARTFSQAGYDIILAARNTGTLLPLADDIMIRSNQQVYVTSFDATAFETHADFIKNLPVKPYGVICAFGFLGDQTKAEDSFREAHTIIDSNYTGAVSLLGRLALLFEARQAGFIVGISSVAGDRGRSSNYVYGSAKAGYTAFLSGLRNRLQRKNVQVITVKPGFVRTAMTEGLNLPKALTAEPEQVAKDIFTAVQKNKDVVYSKWFWKYIMLIIRHIPEPLFKRLAL